MRHSGYNKRPKPAFKSYMFETLGFLLLRWKGCLASLWRSPFLSSFSRTQFSFSCFIYKMLVILSSWNLFYMCMRICKSHKVDLNIALAGDVTCLLCNISCCRVLHCLAKPCKLLLVHFFALESCTFERNFGHNFPQFTETGDLQESACIDPSFWHRMEAALGISTFSGHTLKLEALECSYFVFTKPLLQNAKNLRACTSNC